MGLDIYFIKKNKKSKEEKQIAYFRKVNFLVRFMESYGEIENCKDFKVSKEMIEDLRDRCSLIIKTRDPQKKEELARMFLPTRSGFFFGSTDYDDWYYNNVKEVKAACNKILTQMEKLKTTESIYFHIWY